MNCLVSLGFDSYRDYLLSDIWARRREKYRDSHPPACSICLSTDRLELHHKTYANLGNENDNELCWLCHSCHEQTHQQNQRFDSNGNELATHKQLTFLVQIGVDYDTAASLPKKLATTTLADRHRQYSSYGQKSSDISQP